MEARIRLMTRWQQKGAEPVDGGWGIIMVRAQGEVEMRRIRWGDRREEGEGGIRDREAVCLTT